MDEESKKIILARRARFVAAALASVGIMGQACGGESNSNPRDPNELNGSAGQSSAGKVGVGGAPQPCLSVAGTPGYAGSIGLAGTAAMAGGGYGGTAAGTGGAPQPCLGMTLGGSGGTPPQPGGAGGIAGAGGLPQPCLSAPLGGAGGLQDGGTGGLEGGGAGGAFEQSGAAGTPGSGAGGEGGNV